MLLLHTSTGPIVLLYHSNSPCVATTTLWGGQRPPEAQGGLPDNFRKTHFSDPGRPGPSGPFLRLPEASGGLRGLAGWPTEAYGGL